MAAPGSQPYAVAAAGAIPIPVQLLSSNDAQLRSASVAALNNVLREQPAHIRAFASAGGLPPLLNSLAASSDSMLQGGARLAAVPAVHGDDGVQDDVRHALVAGGAVQSQAGMLRTRKAHARCLACLAVRHVFKEGRHPQAALQHSLATQQRVPSVSQPQPCTAAAQPGPAPSTAIQRHAPAPRVCAAPGCGTARGLRRCGGCGTVRYRSEDCRNSSWGARKAECKRLQAEQQRRRAGQPSSSSSSSRAASAQAPTAAPCTACTAVAAATLCITAAQPDQQLISSPQGVRS